MGIQDTDYTRKHQDFVEEIDKAIEHLRTLATAFRQTGNMEMEYTLVRISNNLSYAAKLNKEAFDKMALAVQPVDPNRGNKEQ